MCNVNETSVCYYPHPLLPPAPPLHGICLSPFKAILYVLWLYFCCPNTRDAAVYAWKQSPKHRSFTYIQLFHVASLLKHGTSRIRKQEGSCPVMCVWLSVGCCKQAEEMWMWLTLPDWLSALAPGYKHAFLVIYRRGVVSHKASGWGGRESKTTVLNSSLTNILQEIHTDCSIKSFRPPGSPTVVNCNL